MLTTRTWGTNADQLCGPEGPTNHQNSLENTPDLPFFFHSKLRPAIIQLATQPNLHLLADDLTLYSNSKQRRVIQDVALHDPNPHRPRE